MRLKYLKLTICDVFLYAKLIRTPYICIGFRMLLKFDSRRAETFSYFGEADESI